MLSFQNKIILTILIVLVLFLFIYIHKNLLKRYIKKKGIDINRRKIILYFGNILIYTISFFIIGIVWGVDFKQFIVFISSIVAVLGIGFFAQWSILSNLTSSVILFFYHPMRIGDKIKILDKDFEWIGIIKDITGFYVYIKTDAGEDITLPTSLVIQKGIQLFDKSQQ